MVERMQAEEQKRLAEMQATMRAEKDRQMRAMADEREKQKRLEVLRKEVDHQMAQSKVQQKKSVMSPQKKQVSKRAARTQFDAAFTPEDVVDHILLGEYSSRPTPDPSLPRVIFKKKNDEYFIGQRKFSVRLDGSSVIVVSGAEEELFLTWIERVERTEALKLRGLNSAKIFMNFSIAQGSV